jgi:hypothetical protein
VKFEINPEIAQKLYEEFAAKDGEIVKRIDKFLKDKGIDLKPSKEIRVPLTLKGESK